MRKSASKKPFRKVLFSAKGKEASILRQKKYKLIRKYGLPENLLGGSLTCTQRKCGKPSCHCASGDGHPQWIYTFSLNGIKQTRTVPKKDVALLQSLVEQGREYHNAVRKLFSINAQLFDLWRRDGAKRLDR